MKAKFFVVLAVLACSLLVATPAWAACVEDADTFCLDTPNKIGGDAIVVQIDLVGTTLTVTIADDAGNSNLKIFDVGMYNSNGQKFVDGSASGWDAEPGPGECCDGFDGTLGEPQSATSFGSGGDTTDTIVFNLSGAPTFGANGPVFSVHIGGLDNGCSLWLTNGNFTPTEQTDSGCGSTEVPEPGSLALLGTGLFGAVGALRRKLLKA